LPRERKKTADGNAALEHWKGQLIERYNEDMASYNEGCTTFAAEVSPRNSGQRNLLTQQKAGRQSN